MTRVSLSYSPRGRDGRYTWSRKEEEYIADFCLMAKRHLNDVEHAVFRYHFLLGGDWRLCCRRLKIDRGNFFHMVYRIMHKLGRAFRETQPYGLFPTNEYFATTVSGAKPCVVPRRRSGAPLEPPLREAA